MKKEQADMEEQLKVRWTGLFDGEAAALWNFSTFLMYS